MSILFFIVYFSEFIDGYQLFAIGEHFGVLINTVALGLMYIGLILKLIFTKDKLYIYSDNSIKFYMVLICAVFLSGIYPLIMGSEKLIMQYFKTSSHFYLVAGFVFVCFAYKIKNSVWTKVIQSWLVCSIFVNIYAIYQVIGRATGLPFTDLEVNNASLKMRGWLQNDPTQQLTVQFENFYRASSFFTEPSALAFFNALMLIFLIVPFVQKKQHFFHNKTFLVIAFILSLIGMLLAFSLTGLLCVTIIFATMIFLENKKYIFNVLGILAIGVVLIVSVDSIIEEHIGTSVVELFETRILGITQGGMNVNKQLGGESFTDRVTTILEAFTVWKKSPVTGVGIGTFGHQPEASYMFVDQAVSSLLAETGIIGFIGFVGMLICLIKEAYKVKKKSYLATQPDDSRLEGIGIYIAVLLAILTSATMNQCVGAVLWCNLGVVFSIIRNAKAREASNIAIKNE